MSVNNTNAVAPSAINPAAAPPTQTVQPAATEVRAPEQTPQQELESKLKGGEEAPQAQKTPQQDPRADNKADAQAAKNGQEAKKQEANQKTAEDKAKSGATAQAVGGGLMAAGGIAACFPPIGTIVGAALAVVGAIVSFFGGQAQKNAQEQAAQVQNAEASQKIASDKVTNHQRETAAPEFTEGQKSSVGHLMAEKSKDAAGASEQDGKPSAAAKATLNAGKGVTA